MKFCLAVLAALVAVGMSAVTIHSMIRHEVHYLYNVDKDMSVDHCTTKCDALFDLVAGHDERNTDKWCHVECLCQKQHNCTQMGQQRTTTAPPPVSTMLKTNVPTTTSAPPTTVQ